MLLVPSEEKYLRVLFSDAYFDHHHIHHFHLARTLNKADKVPIIAELYHLLILLLSCHVCDYNLFVIWLVTVVGK